MADDKSAANGGNNDAPDAPEPKSSKAIKLADGSPKLDFLTWDEASAQAKALGKGASVVPAGVAFHVATDKE